MAQELIITSVRRGLDGDSGYQTVLRTRGMRPAVAERMAMRSGYAHPFPFGDRRNPTIYLHRLERIGGQSHHILGRICDAGGDYSGRSNFLSHLVWLEDGEARRKSAGPADILRRFAFRTAWVDTPREADPPTLIGGDRPPEPCEAWRRFGIDPGLAGDLAEAAEAGRESRIICREDDDVLTLFAEALALVSPARRWTVTFNTCELEPSDALWRATRADLAAAGSWRGSPGVIDLTDPAARGSDGPFALFARGDAATLPWQPRASAANPSGSLPAEIPQALPPAAFPGSTAAPPAPTRSEPSWVPPPAHADSNAASRPPPPPPDEGSVHHPHAVRPPISDTDGRDDGGRQPGAGSPTRSRALQSVGLIAALLLLFAILAGFSLLLCDPHAVAWLSSRWRSLYAATGPRSPKPDSDRPSHDQFDLGGAIQSQRQQHQLEESRKAQQAKDEAKAQQQAATAEQGRMVPLAEAEQKAATEEEKRQKEAAAAARMRKSDAYAAIKALDGLPREDLPCIVGSRLDRPTIRPVGIAPLDMDSLDGLTLDLATPREAIPEGDPFKAWVVREADNPPTWRILSQGLVAVDGKTATPIELATLSIQDGILSFVPESAAIIETPRYALLCRSVLLIRVRDPAAVSPPSGDATAPPVVKGIQLVRPRAIPDRPVAVFSQKHETEEAGADNYVWKFMTARGPSAKVPAIPQAATIDYSVLFGDPPKAIKPPPGNTAEDAYHSLQDCYYPSDGPGKPSKANATIGLRIVISKPQGLMRFIPAIDGPAARESTIPEILDAVTIEDQDLTDRIESLRRGVNNQVDYLTGLRPWHYPDPANTRRLWGFIHSRGSDFKVYLARKQSPKDENAADPDAVFHNWYNQVNDLSLKANTQRKRIGTREDLSKTIVVTEADIQRDLAPILDSWTNLYEKPLMEWKNDFLMREKERLESLRKHYLPLRGLLTVRIDAIVAPAFDADGHEYPVLLATPADSPQTVAPTTDSAPEDQPPRPAL